MKNLCVSVVCEGIFVGKVGLVPLALLLWQTEEKESVMVVEVVVLN